MENEFHSDAKVRPWVGTPLCDQYRDVPLDRAVFVSVLNRVYNFARVCPKKGTHFRASLLLNSVYDSRFHDLSHALTSWQMISHAFSKSQTLKKIWSCRVRFQVR